MRSLAAFLRLVTPPDPYQALFLFGAFCLFISPQLRCFPIVPEYATAANFSVYQSWLRFSVSARLPIFFAGAAAFFLCVWPSSHHLRRILGFVLLPAFVGFIALCYRFIYLAQRPDFPHASVPQATPLNEAWAISTVWSLDPAVHVIFVGLVLVLVFALRLALRVSSLPVCLTPLGHAVPDHEAVWQHILVFVWISIVCISAINGVTSALLWGFHSLITRFLHFRSFPPQLALIIAASTACLAAIAAWAVGERRWMDLRRFIRLPEIKFMLLGAVFPIAIQMMPGFVAYLADRIHWAAYEFSTLAPPDFVSYFDSPKLVYLWYLIGASFEEIAWRGNLQPHFIQRFGLQRGIFLLGVAWSAFHFEGDFQKTDGDYAVFLTLVFRLSFCIAMSYVLGWLVLRSGSIWPAALTHGLSNVWTFSGAYALDGRQSVYTTRIIIAVCWGLLGVALFSYWPPSIVGDSPLPDTDIGTGATRLDVLQ
jgi:membrane protease YdiL (CAAX protease family)